MEEEWVDPFPNQWPCVLFLLVVIWVFTAGAIWSAINILEGIHL